MKAGRLPEAERLARRGLEVDPASDTAPLGYYVLADVYNRQGQPGKAQEASRAREAEVRKRASPNARAAARGDASLARSRWCSCLAAMGCRGRVQSPPMKAGLAPGRPLPRPSSS